MRGPMAVLMDSGTMNRVIIIISLFLASVSMAQGMTGGRRGPSAVGDAIPVRCVNAAGNAYESCAGSAGSSGLTDSELRASPPAVSAYVGFDGGVVSVMGTVSVTGPITDSQLRASPPVVSAYVGFDGGLVTVPRHWVDVSFDGGAVSVMNFPASQAVTGTFFQVTQPVSIASMPSTPVTGPITDAQLRASQVQVGAYVELDGGYVKITGNPVVSSYVGFDGGVVSIMGSVAVTGPLTDAQVRASQVQVGSYVEMDGGYVRITGNPVVSAYVGFDGGVVSVMGTVSVSGPVTDAQLRAAAVPVSGTVTANAGSGTMSVSAASLPLPSGASTAAKQPALGTAGAASADVITVQGVASMTALKTDGSGVTQPVSGTVTANAGSGTMAVSGPLTDGQLRATPVPVSGTVTANAGSGTMAVSIASMPSTPVTGTFYQSSQPISGSSMDGTTRTVRLDDYGSQIVVQAASPLGAQKSLLQPCNAVRRTNCR